MLIFSVVLFFSFIYFIAKLAALFNAKQPPSNNTYTDSTQGVTIECTEYRVKKS